MRFLLAAIFYIISLSYLYSQNAGGVKPFSAAPVEPAANQLDIGSYIGGVNVFSGSFENQINLGVVTTPGGLSYSVNLSYSSKNETGNSPDHLSGIPYGEGWNLSLPRISIQTISRRDRLPGRDFPKNSKRENFHNDDLSNEGEVYYHAPFLSLPNGASGRLILKEMDGTKAIFVLESFESYVEAILHGSTWVVKLEDGTQYEFNYIQKRLRSPSYNRLNRLYSDCIVRDTLINYDSVCVKRDSISPNGIPYGGCSEYKLVERLIIKPCSSFTLVDKGNPINEELGKSIIPKTEILCWYPSKIYNVSKKNQYILFEYETFGHFEFFGEHRQRLYQSVFSRKLFHELYGFDTSNFDFLVPFFESNTEPGDPPIPWQVVGRRKSNIKAYCSDIFLTRVKAIDNTLFPIPTEILELNYSTFDFQKDSLSGSGESALVFDKGYANLLLWLEDPQVKRYDSLYSFRVVYHKGKETQDGILYNHNLGLNTSFYNVNSSLGWSRYRHLRSDHFLFKNPGITVPYDAKERPSNIFDSWGGNYNRDIISTKISQFDPYSSKLDNSQASEYYHSGHQKLEPWNSSSIEFDHSFLESERIKGRFPSGDYYELKTLLSTTSDGNANFDINIVSGSNITQPTYSLISDPRVNHNSNIITLSSLFNSKHLPAIKTDYPNRKFGIFSTFSNPVKWNIIMHNPSGKKLVTSNMFLMPNMPNEYDGFHVQIGPGTSDAYNQMGRFHDERNYLLNPNTSTNRFSAHKAYYTRANSSQIRTGFLCNTPYPVTKNFSLFIQGNQPHDQDKEGFLLWDTDPIPQSFGTGQPWFMMDGLIQEALGRNRDASDWENDYKLTYHAFWWNNTRAPDDYDHSSNANPFVTFSGGKFRTNSSTPNKPTAIDASYHLEAVQLVRYSKNPYVLSNVKFYKLKGPYDYFSEYLNSGWEEEHLTSMKRFS